MKTILLLAVVMIFLGWVAKYADLVNEHGLREHFRGAGIISGFLWGAACIALLIVSPLGGLTYVAHILYWFQRVKLEYPNHATAGVMMILGAFWFQGEFLYERRIELLAVFLAYLITGWIQGYYKKNRPETRKFWRLRLRIYLVPAVYSVYVWSWEPFLATFFGMIGCEAITALYKQYEQDPRETKPEPTVAATR
jgi:hypothetical protein